MALESAGFCDFKHSSYKYRAQILGHEYGPKAYASEYTYISGDVAGAYDDNVQEAVRSMLFLNLDDSEYPAAFVVFDQITSTEVNTTKSFLLHSLTEPSVNGNTITIVNDEEGYNGKLVDQVLYVGTADTADTNYKIELIGGEGKEFWVGGANHPNTSSVADSYAYEPGWGRVEVSTKTATENQTDYMLNVMYVSDANGNAEVVPATLIQGAGVMGAQLLDHVAIFNMDANHRIEDEVTFTVPENQAYSQFKVNVAGLKAGTWTVAVNDTVVGDYVSSESGGIIYVTAGAGEYKITYKNSDSDKEHESDVPDQGEAILVMVNGNYVYSDVTASKVEDNIMIPIVAVFNALKSEVVWRGDSAEIVYMGKTISVDGVNYKASVNGTNIDLTGMQIYENEFLVSIAAIGEMIGDLGDVTWNENTLTVYINAKTPIDIPVDTRDFENVIQVVNAYAGGEYDHENIDRTLDNATSSYWAMEGYNGEGWGVYDFGEVYNLDTLQIMFRTCETREYTFEILYSEDGLNYTSAGKFTSAKVSADTYQQFDMPDDTLARYVKFVGYGNTSNQWCSVQEVVFIGTKLLNGSVIDDNGASVYQEIGSEIILGKLNKEDTVQILDTVVSGNETWCKIIYDDSFGWIKRETVALYAEEGEPSAAKGSISSENGTDVLNMPTNDALVIGNSEKDSAVEILEITEIDGVSYGRINYNGYQGWISMADVSLVDSGEEEEDENPVEENQHLVIEAEDTDIVTLITEADTTFGNLIPVTIAESAAASGGKVAKFSWSGRQSSYTTYGVTDETAQPAHISFSVTAEKTADYYVWARLSVEGQTKTINSYIDGIVYRALNATSATGWQYEMISRDDIYSMDESDFIWVRLGVCQWTEGNSYKVRLRGRDGLVSFDQFVVTTDATYAPNMDALAVFETEETVEAEDTTLDLFMATVVEDTSVENGKYVTLDAVYKNDDLMYGTKGIAPEVGFKVTAVEVGTHYIWARVKNNYNAYLSIAGSGTDYVYKYYTPGDTVASEYGWVLLGTYDVSEAGESISVRIRARVKGLQFDQFYVTADSEFTGVVTHEHTFSEEWSNDISYHWHAATCEHTTEVADYATHTYDDDSDANCNVCGYTREVHQHTFSTDWSSDDSHHWHVATCGCASEVSDKLEHTYGTNDRCTACGAVKTYSVGDGTITIQAENVTLFTEQDSTFGNLTPVSIVEDTAASGGSVARFGWSGRKSSYTTYNQTDLTAYPAHISFQVNAEATATYYVWLKLYNTGSDQTIHSYIDGNNYANFSAGTKTGWCYDLITFTDYNSTVMNGYVWRLIGVCDWTEGESYSVRLRGRDGSTSFDEFVVTTDPGFAPNQDAELKSFAMDTVIEAESATLDYSRISVVQDDAASGSAYVSVDKVTDTADAANFLWTTNAPGHISFQVTATEPGTYFVWANVIKYSTLWSSICGAETDHSYQYYKPAGTGWQKVGSYTVTAAGEVICVRILGRQTSGGNQIDQFYVTADSSWDGTVDTSAE